MHVSYEKRLLRVLDYVFDNLDGDLSLDQLADVAALSRFHFTRVFSGVTGETVAQFTRRVRLARAGHELTDTDHSIEKIAGLCGYSNPRSFTHSFRGHFGMSPSAFRKQGIPLPPLRLNKHGDLEMYDVEIKDLPAHALAGVPHQGAYIEIGRAFEKAVTSVFAQGLGAQMGPMIGLYYDDPDAVEEKDLRSFAGVSLDPSARPQSPLVGQELLGGKYAVLRHIGPYTGLRSAYKFLYGEWLPKSGETPRDQPPYELYENNPQDTKPEDLSTLICIALA